LSLDILIPGLFPVPPEMRFPSLERWVARADLSREETTSAEAWLARRFGLEGLPVAAITLAVDEAPQPGAWMRADPVYVRVERDTLVLHDASVLEVAPEEARALVATLREHFASDGIEFRVPKPDRWYARVPKEELPVTTPLGEAVGADVFDRLPRGSGRINWPSAVTEVQMLFATHPVNLAREAERRPPINGIWFWGEGSLPAEVRSPYRRIHADDPFASGLGHLASAQVSPVPAAIDALEAEEPALAVLDAASPGLDDAWFAKLGSTISRWGTVRLVMPSRTRTLIATLTRGARWRLFRTARPLESHA
jgi:hypothetical protein